MSMSSKPFDLSISLEFRDNNKIPYFEYAVQQRHNEDESDIIPLGHVRVYYEIEKDQFIVIPIHISQRRIVARPAIKYTPDLYIAPFFVKNESHFNCVIYNVLQSWSLYGFEEEDSFFYFYIGSQTVFNCPLSTMISYEVEINEDSDTYEPFYALKDQVKKRYDRSMHGPVTRSVAGKIGLPNEIVNLVVDFAFPMANF